VFVGEGRHQQKGAFVRTSSTFLAASAVPVHGFSPSSASTITDFARYEPETPSILNPHAALPMADPATTAFPVSGTNAPAAALSYTPHMRVLAPASLATVPPSDSLKDPLSLAAGIGIDPSTALTLPGAAGLASVKHTVDAAVSGEAAATAAAIQVIALHLALAVISIAFAGPCGWRAAGIGRLGGEYKHRH
jgi:hypothetical protein